MSFLSYRKGSLPILITMGVLALLGIIIIVAAAIFVGRYSGAGSGMNSSSNGGLCDAVPKTYGDIFTEAANSQNNEISAPMLAAFFITEHGYVEEYRPGYAPTGQKNDKWPEQNGDPNAITHWQDGKIIKDGPLKGQHAYGPMQFMPDTWKVYGSNNLEDAQNISLSAAATAKYMAANLKSQSGDIRKAIFLYNHSDDYVNTILKRTTEFTCAGGGAVLAGRLNVPYIEQADYNGCGRASQAMVIAFFDPANINQYRQSSFQSHGLSVDTINNFTKKFTHKNYVWDYPPASQGIDTAIKSLAQGYPVIVYTDISSQGKHIFVLTGFDGQKFWANDTFGSPERAKDTQTIGGIPLTRDNLQSHLSEQGGHTFLYIKDFGG